MRELVCLLVESQALYLPPVSYCQSLPNESFAACFTIGITMGCYLLFGAPHLVQWQMARTGKTQKSTDKFQFGVSHLLVIMAIVALFLGLLANGLNFQLLTKQMHK